MARKYTMWSSMRGISIIGYNDITFSCRLGSIAAVAAEKGRNCISMHPHSVALSEIQMDFIGSQMPSDDII